MGDYYVINNIELVFKKYINILDIFLALRCIRAAMCGMHIAAYTEGIFPVCFFPFPTFRQILKTSVSSGI